MESGKPVSFALASTVVIFCVIGCVSSKPPIPMMDQQQQWSNSPQEAVSSYELHPIDSCIFTCDRCFKGDALVKCANQCILSEGAMGIEWTLTCPYLSNSRAGLINPFRH